MLLVWKESSNGVGGEKRVRTWRRCTESFDDSDGAQARGSVGGCTSLYCTPVGTMWGLVARSRAPNAIATCSGVVRRTASRSAWLRGRGSTPVVQYAGVGGCAQSVVTVSRRTMAAAAWCTVRPHVRAATENGGDEKTGKMKKYFDSYDDVLGKSRRGGRTAVEGLTEDTLYWADEKRIDPTKVAVQRADGLDEYVPVGENEAFAVVEYSGRQYRAVVGDVLLANRIKDVEAGDEIDLSNVVLLAATQKATAIGRPYVDGVKVIVRVEEVRSVGRAVMRWSLAFYVSPWHGAHRGNGSVGKHGILHGAMSHMPIVVSLYCPLSFSLCFRPLVGCIHV